MFNCCIIFLLISSATAISGDWIMLPEGAPGRAFGSMIFRETDGCFYLFGGMNNGLLLNDFWKYDPAEQIWTELSTIDPPSPRFGHTAAYDPNQDIMYVYAGWTEQLENGELWAYSLAYDVWYLLTQGGDIPEPRFLHATAFNTADSILFLFGGRVYDRHTYLYYVNEDTWWQWENPDSIPPPEPERRRGHGCVYMPEDNSAYIFSGRTSFDPGQIFNDLWRYSFDDTLWYEIPMDGFRPNGRYDMTMTSDPSNNRFLMFGGVTLGGTYLNDLWVFQPVDTTWQRLSPGGQIPAGRSAAAGAYDYVNGWLVVFGGINFQYYYNDGYIINLAPTSVDDETSPLPREAITARSYPNPFNNSTVLEIRSPVRPQIEIFDLAGRRVGRLDAAGSNGSYRAVWDGRSQAGSNVSSGIYLYRVFSGDLSITEKIVFIK